MAPLSNHQKFILSDLARQAWSKQSEGFRREIDQTHFRHLIVTEAVGKAGLRSCTQADYADIKRHFLQLLQREGAAVKADVRGQDNPRRVALWKLEAACKLAGVTLAYARTICHSKFKCSLEDAKTNQLWILKYDLDRAIKRRRQKIDPSDPSISRGDATPSDPVVNYQLKP